MISDIVKLRMLLITMREIKHHLNDDEVNALLLILYKATKRLEKEGRVEYVESEE